MEDRKLHDWIDSYLKFTSNDEPRETFRQFTAISTVAACLQRKCYVNWEETIFPNLYIVLVGPPASRKNTAIVPAEKMIRELGIPVSAQATTPEALIRKMRKISESVAISEESIIAPQDAAMTIISKEFTAFIGVRNLDLITLLTDWYDCSDDWTRETKTQGTDALKNVWVNLLAATTPTALKDSLPRESIGMGLTSRIIFVYEEDKDKVIMFSPGVDVWDEELGKARKLDDSQHEEWDLLRLDLIHDLSQVSMMQGTFIPTGDYHKAYYTWRKGHEENMPFKGTMLENYSNRKQTHIRKLSMIFSASRSNDLMLTEIDFERSLKSLNKVERKMSNVFSGIGKSEVSETTNSIMHLLAKRGKMTQSQLLKMFWNDVDAGTLDKILQTMERMKFCRREFKGSEVIIHYIEEKKD